MKISERSITALAKIITGDTEISPYRNGPMLVKLFNEFGSNDVYGQGFPSRWKYTEEKIRLINNSPTLDRLLEHLLDPRDWIEYKKPIEETICYLNEYLKYDGYEIYAKGDFFYLRPLNERVVEFTMPSAASQEVNQKFIEQQINKCDEKLINGDYDGAITNARSLIEAVLIDIEQELSLTSPSPFDGDLPRLYKRVSLLINLDPGRKDISEPLKQVISGLVNIVHGISSLRNKMGDAHIRSYQPEKRHAYLVVNSAKTLAIFLLECREMGRIK